MKYLRWTKEETAILLADNEAGVPRTETATKLGRAVSSVYERARTMGLSRPRSPADDEKLRSRWAMMLPRLKEDLRRQINI